MSHRDEYVERLRGTRLIRRACRNCYSSRNVLTKGNKERKRELVLRGVQQQGERTTQGKGWDKKKFSYCCVCGELRCSFLRGPSKDIGRKNEKEKMGGAGASKCLQSKAIEGECFRLEELK